MDVVLRAQHDLLAGEFLCRATELTVVRTPAGSTYTRSIDAFCGDERAPLFGSILTDFVSCCASCSFLSPRVEDESDVTTDTDAALEAS